jgi:transposase-like protein
MAAVHHSPTSTVIEDAVTYREASALLKDTGHPASPGTIARWVREANAAGANITVERSGRPDRVSWTAVARLHRDRTAVKLRASSNWP